MPVGSPAGAPRRRCDRIAAWLGASQLRDRLFRGVRCEGFARGLATSTRVTAGGRR